MRKHGLVVLISILSFSAALAQTTPENSTGIEPIYSYKGGLTEAINLYDGNLNVGVPLIRLKGRAGLDLAVNLAYNSRQMKFAYNEWGNTASWNYPGPNMGRWVANFSPFLVENGANAGVTFEDGTQHPFTDGMSTNGSDMQYNGATKTALLKSGIWYNFANAGEVQKGDANGNYIRYIKDGAGKTTQIIDTLGRSVNIYYENPSDATLPSRITVLNHTGLPAQILTYTFEYEFRNVNPTTYGYTPVGITAGNYPFLTRINLPDGKFWAFIYYHGVSASTLLLASLTYPMGGTTTYNYTGSNAQLDAKCKQKLTNANNGQGNVTTTYQHSHCYPANQPPDNCSGDPQAIHSVNVIDPDNTTTNVIFNADGKEGSRTSPGRSEYTTWTGSHVQIKQVIVDGYETRTDYQYDPGNWNLLQEEVKPGSGMGTDLNFRGRRTVRTWQSFGNNVYRVQTENVYDLNNALATSLVSQTQYGYDEYVTYPMTDRGAGVAGHLDSYNTGYTTRGNVTTVSRWLASESRWIATHSFYDTLGNVVKTRDAKNYDTVINYGSINAFAYPTQVINPKGHTTNTVYKFYTGQVESVTNANNFTTTTWYDSLNRITRIDFPDTSYVRATYDLTVNNFSTTVYKSIAAGQEASTTTYLDGIGRQKQKKTTDPAGDVYVDTVYQVCDCSGKVDKVSNPYRLGETVYWTQTKYDGLGRATKVIPPDGTETQNYTSYTYGPMKTVVSDPAGKTRRYHYDVVGRIWKVVPNDNRPDPFSGTMTHESAIYASMHQHFFTSPAMPVGVGDALYAYVYLDPKNMPAEVMLQWNDGAGWEHRAYWGADNIAWGVNGTNSRRYMGALPASGQWVRLEVPASLVGLDGQNVYGAAFTLYGGRAWWDKSGAGGFVWFDDALPAGAVPSGANESWSWVPAPDYVAYDYLPTLGQNKLVITQGVQLRTFNYDTLGRLTSEVHPENGTTSYTYDDNDNVNAKTDARGWVTNNTYDQLNRLTGKSYLNDGGITPTVSWAYDTALNGVGQLASWSSGNGHSEAFDYNSMGRTTQDRKIIAGLPLQSVSYTYNLAGEVITTTYPNGWTTSSGYDGVGNLENIYSSFAGSLVSNVDRNAAGQPTLVAYGNGVNNTRTYNSGLQLSNLLVTGPGGTYFNKTYNYNAGTANNGRITSITDNLDANNTISYTYDELNRLATAATAGPAWGLSWTYDRFGNRLGQARSKGDPALVPTNDVTLQTGNNNKVDQARYNGAPFQSWLYDPAGNVTNDARHTYSYDAENRVISMDSGATTYSYDAFGGRVRKTTGPTVTRYFLAWRKMSMAPGRRSLLPPPQESLNGTAPMG